MMPANSPSTALFALGFAVATALASVIAIFVHPASAQDYKLWSQEAAGWAQAVGAIFAIFGAYWISNHQQLKIQIAEEKTAIKKATSLGHFFAPVLKTIEADVAALLEVSNQHKNIGMRDLTRFDVEAFRFRPIPNIKLILDHAYNLPADLSKTIPQLLGFRAITDVNLSNIIERAKKTGYIDGYQLRLIIKWLVLMNAIVEDVYKDMPVIHD